MPVLLALLGVFLAAATYQIGVHAGDHLWFPVIVVALVAATLALLWWHRRQMAALQSAHLTAQGNWHRMSLLREWPKYCGRCGLVVPAWKIAVIHDNYTSSPCANLAAELDRLDEAERLDELDRPGSKWRVDAVEPVPEPVEAAQADAIEGGLADGPHTAPAARAAPAAPAAPATRAAPAQAYALDGRVELALLR